MWNKTGGKVSPCRRQHANGRQPHAWVHGSPIVALVVVAMLMGVLIAACNADDSETVKPYVVSTDPTESETNVALDKAIDVTFSEPMDLNSFEQYVSIELADDLCCQLAFITSASGSLVTVTPDEPFNPNAAHTLELGAGLKDLAGNTMGSAYTLKFTTGSESGGGNGSGGGSDSADLQISLDSVSNTSSSASDVTFTVTNNGEGNAGAFDVMIWSNRTAAPDTSSAQSGASESFTSLAAGASQQITADGPGGTWVGGTAYTAYVYADFFQDVDEANETNNLASLQWTAGTPLTIGTPDTSGSLASGATSAYIFTPATTGQHTIFVYDRSDTADTWSIDGYDGQSASSLGTVSTDGTGSQTAGTAQAFDVSHDGDATVTYSIVVVQGNGLEGSSSSPEALDFGSNTRSLAETGSSEYHYYQFTAGAAATHTITVTSTTLDLSYQLFSDPFTTPETVGIGFTNCTASSGTAQCTTTNALNNGDTYYMRVFSGSPTESYDDDVSITIATP